MQSPRRTQADRRAETRAALLRAGARLFAAKGYAETGAEEIVAAAGVTRGALYHHFKDKADLFQAVVEQAFSDIVAEIDAAADAAPDAASALRRGALAWLRASQHKTRRRILLIDAPAVLGWEKWRALDSRYGMGSLREGLAAAARERAIKLADIEIAAHLLSGALNEAALLLAANARDSAFQLRLEASVNALLDCILEAQRGGAKR
jgi:AcrR family transcriptional regulator